MGPKTKASTAKFLLGQPVSALRQDFLQAIQEGKGGGDILPWLGPLQLPTVEQVLKLFFYFREVAGLKNSSVSRGEVVNKVADQVVRYWSMAGFMTMKMFNVVIKIKKEVEKYEQLQKNRSKTTEKEVMKREGYLEEIKKLFDIATPNLEDILTKSRLLSTDDEDTRYRQDTGYTRKTEDLSFLLDQRSERKMVMGHRDTSYEERVEANKARKSAVSGGVAGSSQGPAFSQPVSGVEEIDDGEKDMNENDQRDIHHAFR